MAELFRTEGLTHRFRNGAYGLRSVDVRVDEGEFMLLAGRNGSGKTLLARHLVGLSAPSEGRVLFKGKPVRDALKELRTQVGFVFQDTDSQILGQTVREDAAFGPSNMRLAPGEIDARVDEALSETKLSGMAERRPETLSGGEKRRLAIAGILAMRPSCLILDEPFANLDLDSVKDVLAICETLKRKGMTFIVVTHEIEKIYSLADRLVILSKGEKRFDGAPSLADPSVYGTYGLVCPLEGHFPWVYHVGQSSEPAP